MWWLASDLPLIRKAPGASGTWAACRPRSARNLNPRCSRYGSQLHSPVLKDILAEAGVPTVGDNDLVDLDPPLFLPESDLVRFLCKTDMLSESFAQKLPSLCLIVFSSAHCSYRTSNPIPLNPQEKAFLSVTQTAAFGLLRQSPRRVEDGMEARSATHSSCAGGCRALESRRLMVSWCGNQGQRHGGQG
jgi:hypothetical protein